MRAFILISILALAALCAARPAQLPPPPQSFAGPAAPVPSTYFGMHIHRPLTTTPWPSLHFRSLRLWDTGTTWAAIEPRKGVWQFETLDGLVDLAATHQIQVLLCFGHTPGWAYSSLSAVGKKPGSPPPASLDDWRTFVQTVVTRYKGRIGAYEIWNEPSLTEFYSGDVPTIVNMTQDAAAIIHSVDPSALVVSPSATTVKGLPWFRQFLSDGGAAQVNVIGYHFYVTPDSPENIVALAQSVKAAMAEHHIDLPIWDTETGWAKPKLFSSDTEASSYVARSLLLAWASGISRFYWYAWDNRNWTTLNLTAGDDYKPNANAQAYDTIESWMLGKQIERCTIRPDNTWVCDLTASSGESWIFWNPVRKVPFQLPAAVKQITRWHMTDLNGHSTRLNQNGLYADIEPQMISIAPR